MDGQAAEHRERRREVGQAGEPGLGRERLGLREAALAPRAEDPELDPEQGDVVEHQGRDDLVDPEAGPEDARDEAPQTAGDRPGQHHRRDDDDGRRPGRQDRGEDDGARAPGAEQELALRADVPEAHPERQRTRQAGQDQRRRLDQRVADDPDAAEGGDDDVAERADRVAADEPDDQPAQRRTRRRARRGSRPP